MKGVADGPATQHRATATRSDCLACGFDRRELVKAAVGVVLICVKASVQRRGEEVLLPAADIVNVSCPALAVPRRENEVGRLRRFVGGELLDLIVHFHEQLWNTYRVRVRARIVSGAAERHMRILQPRARRREIFSIPDTHKHMHTQRESDAHALAI